MSGLEIKRGAIILAHALVGWALCGATIGIGMAVTTPQTTLIIHAIAAPVFFAGITAFYYGRWGWTTPLVTAAIFLSVVVLLDVLVVALLILRSFRMFESFLGTWLPFMLIFISTLLTGQLERVLRPGAAPARG